MVISYLYCLLSLPLLPLQMLVTHVSMLSHVQLFAAPMDCKPPGSSVHRILQQEYWSGLPFASPGDLPDLGIEPRSPTLQEDSLLVEPPGKPLTICIILGKLFIIFKPHFPYLKTTAHFYFRNLKRLLGNLSETIHIRYEVQWVPDT